MIIRTAKAVGEFAHARWTEYTPFGQFLFALALGALVVDAGISYQYGVSMTQLHGLGFALLAIAFCVLPDVASMEFARGNRIAGFWFSAACIPIGVVAYQSHIGYGAGVRLGDVQQTAVQHARLDAVKASLKSEESNIAMWRKQLADLKARNEEHRDKNKGWLVTTDPVAMKSQLDAMDQRIENEAKRIRCAQKCEELKTQRGHLAAMIDAIKQENDLTGRIEATQRVIDGKVKAVADTGFRSSTVVNQNDTFAKLFRIATGYAPEDAIRPDEVTRDFTNTATAGTASLAFMMLAPILMVAAGRYRRREFFDKLSTGSRHDADKTSTPLPPPKPSVPVVPASTKTIIQRLDGTVAMRNPVTMEVFERKVQAAA